MSGIFSRLKDMLWRAMNAPNTEMVDEMDVDDGYEPDSRDDDYDRVSDWEMPTTSREIRGNDKRARQIQNTKVLEMYGKDGTKSEVILRHPVSVNDAAKVCDFVRDEKLCVIDLTGVDRNMAQRIADFLGGACYAINGTIQRISKDIFIVVPNGVRISADMTEELEKDGYVVPKAYGRR